jgi:hypothetical protein
MKILAETVTYPIKIPLEAGKYIHKKYMLGDYKFFDSPGVFIKE